MNGLDEDYQELIHIADTLHTISEILSEYVDRVVNKEMDRLLHEKTIKNMMPKIKPFINRELRIYAHRSAAVDNQLG